MGARDPRIAPAERQNLPIPFSDEAKARTWINALRKRLLELQRTRHRGLLLSPGTGHAGMDFSPTRGRQDKARPAMREFRSGQA